MAPIRSKLSRARRDVFRHRHVNPSRGFAIAAASIGALVVSAILNQKLAKKAEQDNAASGGFLHVNGVRLHYVERGSGQPLILLHGNGSMIEDFESSGLIEEAAANFRVIAFDRPGFGHSDRPRNVIWTPDAQADLINAALDQLDIHDAIVLGHSWGASVAVAMGLKFPQAVRGLVLASGYYYPSFRPDVIAMSAPAVPVIGDIIAHTVSPVIARMMWPLMLTKVFSPDAIPKKFDRFPKELALRGSQLRASAAETALMLPDAVHFTSRYSELKMPVVIIAGEKDEVVETSNQSVRLHSEIAGSLFHPISGAGHMIHQTATSQVMDAITEVTKLASPKA